jgi:hypothetical protein
LVKKEDVKMKKIILLIILIGFSILAKAQQTTYNLPQRTANCGGFVIDSPIIDKSLTGKTFIYGNVSRCYDKEKGAGSIIEIININSLKIIDTCYADINGNYKITVPSGTYKVWSARPSFGEITINTIDFDAQTSVRMDLYLSIPPTIKN